MESILTSVKKQLGITEECEDFDADIIMHINTVFMILNQIGVGPSECFTIQDKLAIWDDFIPTTQSIEAVKSYMGTKVKLLFDPPSGSGHMEAANRVCNELEWRLNVAAESTTQ